MSRARVVLLLPLAACGIPSVVPLTAAEEGIQIRSCVIRSALPVDPTTPTDFATSAEQLVAGLDGVVRATTLTLDGFPDWDEVFTFTFALDGRVFQEELVEAYDDPAYDDCPDGTWLVAGLDVEVEGVHLSGSGTGEIAWQGDDPLAAFVDFNLDHPTGDPMLIARGEEALSDGLPTSGCPAVVEHFSFGTLDAVPTPWASTAVAAYAYDRHCSALIGLSDGVWTDAP